MKTRTLAALGAGLALAIGATAAQAAVSVVDVKVNVLKGSDFSSNYITFNQYVPVRPAMFTTGGVTFSGSGFVVSGNAAGEYQMPTNDFSPYFALGNSTKAVTRTETLMLNKGATNTFGLYWGSIDTYNKITFLLNGHPVGTITGTDVANFSPTDKVAIQTANGPGKGINTNASAYVNIASTAKFNQIMLQTTQPNFELDNVAVGSVPEASTWAMMLLGLGGLGAVTLYRRRNTTATFIAA